MLVKLIVVKEIFCYPLQLIEVEKQLIRKLHFCVGGITECKGTKIYIILKVKYLTYLLTHKTQFAILKTFKNVTQESSVTLR